MAIPLSMQPPFRELWMSCSICTASDVTSTQKTTMAIPLSMEPPKRERWMSCSICTTSDVTSSQRTTLIECHSIYCPPQQ
eukprot:4537114-Amphidinium_carterae.1